MPLLPNTEDPSKLVSDKMRLTGGPDSMNRTDWNATLSRENPLPGQNYFDKTIDSDLIPQQQNRDFEGILNHGVGDSQLGGAGGMGFGGGDDPMVKALTSRYDDQSKNAVKTITDKNAANAPAMKSGEQSTISQELSAERANDVQNFNAQYAYQLQRHNIYNEWLNANAQATSALQGAMFSGMGALGGAMIGGAVGAGAAKK